MIEEMGRNSLSMPPNCEGSPHNRSEPKDSVSQSLISFDLNLWAG